MYWRAINYGRPLSTIVAWCTAVGGRVAFSSVSTSLTRASSQSRKKGLAGGATSGTPIVGLGMNCIGVAGMAACGDTCVDDAATDASTSSSDGRSWARNEDVSTTSRTYSSSWLLLSSRAASSSSSSSTLAGTDSPDLLAETDAPPPLVNALDLVGSLRLLRSKETATARRLGAYSGLGATASGTVRDRLRTVSNCRPSSSSRSADLGDAGNESALA